MAARAPKKLIEHHFNDFMEECKASISNGCDPKVDVFAYAVVSSTFTKQKGVFAKYQAWMRLPWVHELVISTLKAFKDFSKAKPYPLAWCNENTFMLYKFISIYGPDKKDKYVLKHFPIQTLVAMINEFFHTCYF